MLKGSWDLATRVINSRVAIHININTYNSSKVLLILLIESHDPGISGVWGHQVQGSKPTGFWG